MEKEILPTSFLTSFIGEGWDRIGALKDQIESLGIFAGADKVINILQNLLDNYLICIGCMETELRNCGGLDTEISEVGTPVVPKEAPAEVKTAEPEVVEVEPEIEVEVAPETEIEPKFGPKAAPFINEFEYFVDFDEPDMSEPPLTDDDLYSDDKLKK